MGIFAAVLLIVWMLGIVVLAASVISAVRDENNQNESVLAMRDAMEVNATAVALLLTLVILVWPVSLTYGALKKGLN